MKQATQRKPMSGFLERLKGPVYIARVGHGTHKKGDEYINACVVNVIDGEPIFIAYNSTPPKPEAFKTAALLLAEKKFKSVGFERMGRGSAPTSVHFTFGVDKEGNTTMGKPFKRTARDRKPGRIMPHTDEAVHEDGSVDLNKVLEHIPDIIKSVQSGEYIFRGLTFTDMVSVEPGLEAVTVYRKKAPKK